MIEIVCLSLLGMIANCKKLDIAMLCLIVFIRMFYSKLKHTRGVDNPVADRLSRTKFDPGIEDDIKSWRTIGWRDGVNKEKLARR